MKTLLAAVNFYKQSIFFLFKKKTGFCEQKLQWFYGESYILMKGLVTVLLNVQGRAASARKKER